MTGKSTLHIRVARLSDLDAIKGICVETSFAADDARYKELIPLRWATPYLYYDIESCFVVVDRSASEKVAGYILSALDTHDFREYRYKHYHNEMQDALNKVISEFDENDKGDVKALFSLEPPDITTAEQELIEKYPVHLHIDISPDYQRQGLGSRLMNTLIKHLQEKQALGVHLRVAADNEMGIQFYRKYGYQELLEKDSTLYFGKQV